MSSATPSASAISRRDQPRWLYRVARKHAGNQEVGWQFTMRQLYEKSGSTARLSDFAIDVRKAVGADELPEYSMTIHKNGEGDEVVHFRKRATLPINDPRYEGPRHPRRRLARGITSKPIKFTTLAGG